MKEMTSVATTMMSEEEKAQVERELNGGTSPASPSVSGAPTQPSEQPRTSEASTSAPPVGSSLVLSPDAAHADKNSLDSKSPGVSSTNLQAKEKETNNKKRQKLTPEQRQKLQDLEDERRKKMEERVATLTTKLVDRLRPFVESKHPGDKDDPETKAFEARMQREADDLKLESFGVEVSIFIFEVIFGLAECPI